MKYLHLLSIGANATLLALFAWLHVGGVPGCWPWMLYAILMGALSTLALRKGKQAVQA